MCPEVLSVDRWIILAGDSSVVGSTALAGRTACGLKNVNRSQAYDREMAQRNINARF